jgi:hypothetical protein
MLISDGQMPARNSGIISLAKSLSEMAARLSNKLAITILAAATSSFSWAEIAVRDNQESACPRVTGCKSGGIPIVAHSR